MVLLHNNQNKTDMKKLIPILFVVAVLAACQKEPSLSKLDDDYVVFTDYDKSADFGEYLTYYMPDSVLLITNNEKATYWTNEDADYILETFADNMAARGFTLVDSKEDADLGLQVSYIEVISSIIPMTIGGGDIPDIGDPDIGDHIGTVGIIPIP